MKQKICFLLAIITLLAFTGCQKSGDTPDNPVNFYYCTSVDDYEQLQKTIIPEIREGAGFGNDLHAMLNAYLDGPVSENLVNPFPDLCTVETLTHSESEISLMLSASFAQLNGIDLIMACSCISSTLFDLTGCETIRFSVRNLLLDGNPEIVIHQKDILLNYFK